ncbi:LTA synthase family protein [Sulfurospirillum sp. 1307]|jgi:phosphoglycerol transferase MdoB-like AlkP superfamily enzyme
MSIFTKNRFSLIVLLIALFVGISFITRTVLLGASFNHIDFGLIPLLKLYGAGFFYDLVASLYYVAPFAFYLIIVPNKIFNSKIHKYIIWLFILTQIYAFAFNGVSEWFFWEEFGKRFNFIAVDYLVYTHEVINNILESYPVPLLVSIVLFVSLGIFYFVAKKCTVLDDAFTWEDGFLQRIKLGLIFILLPFVLFNAFNKQGLAHVSKNSYNNELAKNGFYSLFSAFRNNELPYDEFYKSLDDKVAMSNLYKLEGFDGNKIKSIKNEGIEKKPNVVLIMVESLSAEFMGAFGDKRGLTPNLDKLVKQSLFFNNLYATGTRTVRGMEAVTLSLPPTPGRSIVKRPDNFNMFSAGFIFKDKGYDNKFIYAGHGYFDNMNSFFSHNGFNIVDRTDMKDNEITFSNVWGVCDEDLLRRVSKEADKSYKSKKPFFSFVMTTSNHRPYTYPEGRIDIPSHTGRSGAVKYTDFAIDKFINEAKSKPWFDNTIFIIVADHNAGSAGKTQLPVWRYKIPFIVYAPKIVNPGIVSKLSSQVDIMPTLFSMLNWSYKSKFYGNDILNNSFKQRAFIGNYQKLGYLKDNKLLILEPNKTTNEYEIVEQTLRNNKYKEIQVDMQKEKEAITYYQSASYMYKHNLNRWSK